jgi:hypothetical protein
MTTDEIKYIYLFIGFVYFFKLLMFDYGGFEGFKKFVRKEFEDDDDFHEIEDDGYLPFALAVVLTILCFITMIVFPALMVYELMKR